MDSVTMTSPTSPTSPTTQEMAEAKTPEQHSAAHDAATPNAFLTPPTTSAAHPHPHHEEHLLKRHVSHRSAAAATEHPSPPAPLLHHFIYNWLITDPALKGEPHKNYQVQNHDDTHNVFFFGGRLRTIKGRPLNVVTGVLIIVPGVLFWCYGASFIWHNVSRASVIIFSYLWFLTLMFFVRAGTSDPGILPRNIHLPLTVDKTTRTFSADTRTPEEYFSIITTPHLAKGSGAPSTTAPAAAPGAASKGGAPPPDAAYMKYCPTCHVWKPARTSHCNACNCCVLQHDHHCVFLNNCVGPRNYKFFLWFLLCASLTSLMLSTLSFVQVFHYKIVDSVTVTDVGQALDLYPAPFFLAIYSLFAFVYPSLLLGFHLYLTASNLTTREYLNNVWWTSFDPNFKNVFDTGNLFKNLYINWFGKPRGISFVRQTDPYEPGDMRLERVEPLQAFERS